MQHVEREEFAVARKATLNERLVSIGLRPLDPSFVHTHKEQELAAAPKPTRGFRILRFLDRNLGNFALIGIAALLGGFAASFVIGLAQYACVAGGCILAAICTYTGFANGRHIHGPAMWVIEPYARSLDIAPRQVSLLVEQLISENVVRRGNIFCEKLIQDTVVLDPLWWVIEGDERVCIAITDKWQRVIAIA